MAGLPPWLAQATGQGNSSGSAEVSKGAISRRMKKKKKGKGKPPPPPPASENDEDVITG